MNINDIIVDYQTNDELKKNVLISAHNDAIGKYNILLSLLNDILVNIGKEKINQVCEFRKIKKKDIETNENHILLIKNKTILEENFGKYSIVLRNIKKEHSLVVYLKHICNRLNLNLETSKISTKIENENRYTSVNGYTITNK